MPYRDHMVSKALAVLFAVLMIPSVVLWWYERDVINTERYLEVVTPLASDPETRSAIASAISAEVRDNIDLEALMDAAAQDLPPRSAALFRALTEPLQVAVDEYIRHAAEDVLAGEDFHAVWAELNRRAHGRMLTTDGGTVYLELGPIVEALRARLSSQGSDFAARIPAVDKKHPLVKAPLLAHAQRHHRTLRVLMFVLPIVALILLAVAVWLSRDRWQTVLIAAMSTAIAMLVLLAATYLGRPVVAPGTGSTVYNAFAGSLRADIRWVLAISAVTALGTWVLRRRLTNP